MPITGIVGRPAGQIVPLANTTKRTKERSLVLTTDITSTQPGFAVSSCKAVFFSDSSGSWWANLNGYLTWTSATVTTVNVSFVNLAFRVDYGGAASWAGLDAVCRWYSSGSYIAFASTSTAGIVGVRFDITIPLASEPTVYTIAANMEAVGDVTAYIPNADASTTGLLTNAAQNVGGVKDFTNGLKLQSGTILANYAEGSWTPTNPTSANLGGTASFGSATYTRIGNTVFAKLAAITGLTLTTAGNRTYFRIGNNLPGFTSGTVGYGFGSFLGDSSLKTFAFLVQSTAGNFHIELNTTGGTNGETINMNSLLFIYSV